MLYEQSKNKGKKRFLASCAGLDFNPGRKGHTMEEPIIVIMPPFWM